ncbi:hypothetical protein CCACVL1_10208 [Corchorus capsularis]|uniref:Uncharacterized protein n=1 Tax=Corchorus capsularis TaxID=210143 RepID=A0A1R3IS21_COCAP|nr:hypothetical protein CCACVL1_10208 [Corchorus capsularis]
MDMTSIIFVGDLRKTLERYQVHVDEEAAVCNSVHEAAKTQLMMDTVDALHEKVAAEMEVEDGEKDEELNQDPHSDSCQTPHEKGLLQFL